MPGVPADTVLIRREGPADAGAVHALHLAAFARHYPGGAPVEARLVDELRADPGAWLPRLSLVAELGTDVVGHVVCSRGRLDGDVPALGLGPLGVLPGHQGRGAGSLLVHAVCAAADALDETVVVLLGDPAFYGRLGFVAASGLGIVPPVAEWEPHFQARPLAAYDAARDRGDFTYATPFNDL
jgi:putative acetyltransferase